MTQTARWHEVANAACELNEKIAHCGKHPAATGLRGERLLRRVFPNASAVNAYQDLLQSTPEESLLHH